jgi:hypothetical protein
MRTRQISVTVTEELIASADRLIAPLQREDLYRDKIEVSRSFVLRVALANGMRDLVAKYLGDERPEAPGVKDGNADGS